MIMLSMEDCKSINFVIECEDCASEKLYIIFSERGAREVPDMTGVTVAGNGSDKLSIICEFTIGGNVINAVKQKIRESELDIKLKADSSSDGGILTLLIGVVKAAAYAVRNLIFDIIDIVTGQCLVRVS